MRTFVSQPYKFGTLRRMSFTTRTISSSNMINLTPCNSNNEGCTQQITIRISGCNALSGTLTVGYDMVVNFQFLFS